MNSRIKAIPKVADVLRPVTLTQPELGGEIGRRVGALARANFMALDVEGYFIQPFRVRPVTEGHHYVGVGKVIDAGSLFAAFTGEPAMAARARRLIEGVFATRDADGYIGQFKPEPNASQNHRNWVLHEHEYLLLGLVRHWLTTGEEQSLRRARELAEYVMRVFGADPKPEEVCTAGLPEAFISLYEVTGESRYLEFAATIRHGNSTGEVQCASLRTWRQTFETRPAHVYVMLARCYAQTELYRHDGAAGLLEMSRYMRRELLRAGGGLNVVGSASDGEHFSYTQNGAGAIGESCVTAYLLRWLDSLMRLDGDLRYGDLMERTVYNALFAAQAPDGRQIRYFTPFTGPRGYFDRDGFCCPGNFRRIVAELPQKVYYRCADGGVAVNLFTESSATLALAGNVSVTLTQQTDYPNNGRVALTVSPTRAAEFALRLRIPRWCRNATVAVNDEPPVSVPNAIRRLWNPGDRVTLEMPMSWRWLRGHRMQEGKAALARGPVVYCLGTAQNEELLKKYPNFAGVVIEPNSLGEPLRDDSVRPDGRKVTARARGESRGAPQETVTFTEFVDPTGIATYCHVLDLGAAVEDELVGDCFQI